MDKYYSVPEVAKILGVHRNTVDYWVRMGYVKAEKKNPFVSRPQYKIPVAELKRIQKASDVKA